MCRKISAVVKELEQRSGVAPLRAERTRGDHYRLELPNGRSVVIAGTPGDSRRAILNIVSEIRRRA